MPLVVITYNNSTNTTMNTDSIIILFLSLINSFNKYGRGTNNKTLSTVIKIAFKGSIIISTTNANGFQLNILIPNGVLKNNPI